MYFKSYQLDEQLAGRMDQGTIDGRPGEGNFIHRYNRWLISFSCNSLFGLNPSRSSRGSARERSYRSRRTLNLSNIILALCFISTTSVLVSYYYQQQLDYFVFHLDQLDQLNGTTSAAASAFASTWRKIYGPDLDRTQLILPPRPAEARRELASVGGPISGTSYGGHCFLLIWISWSYWAYFNAIAFREFLSEIDSYFVGAALDPREEQLRMNSSRRREVNSFIESNQNFVEIATCRILSLGGGEFGSLVRRSQKLKQQLSDYRSTSNSLHSLLSGRRLIDRSSGHLVKLSRIYFYANLVNQINTTFLASCGSFLVFFYFKLIDLSSLTALDWLILFEFLFIVAVVHFSYLSHMTLAQVNCLDQLRLLSDLELSVWSSLRDVELKINVAPTKRWREKRIEANEQLLATIINYRIFLRQHDRIHNLLNYAAFITVQIAFVVPVLCRIHSPYVSVRVRYLMIFLCVLIFFFTMPTIFMVCYYNERCLKVYKSLSRLMAQVILVESHQREEHLTNFYNQHTLWALRQELAQPDLVKERLASQLLFLSFTYPNLIRLIFWYGLIMISIVMDSSNRSGTNLMFGSFLDDPLGVFKVNFF